MRKNMAESEYRSEFHNKQYSKSPAETHSKYRVHLPNADVELERRCNISAKGKYGIHISDMVQNRLNLELEAIRRNSHSSEYLIGAMLVDKSLSDGYIVSSRGLIGSSFVAYLCGISNVNPLPAHYYCPECYHFESVEDEFCTMGYDLPDKICPICGNTLHGEGANIDPEILMGAKLDREPDIVLNIASEEQNALADYIRNTFGKGNVVRAGVKAILGNGDVHRGVHPGGFFIIPDEVNINDITDLRRDISDDSFKMRVTEQDYHDINGILKKYDMLRNSEIDLLCRLQKITGVKSDVIKTNDPDILTVFLKEGFSFIPNYRDIGEGYNTSILSDMGISCFSDLVAVSAMLHGSCIWENNMNLIRKNGVKIKNLVSNRDDVRQTLISKGLHRELSYEIMNCVCKGKGITAEMESAMRSAGVPAWFIDTCKKIRYLFPRAHTVEYMLIYWKLAYYKLHFPDIYQDLFDKTDSNISPVV